MPATEETWRSQRIMHACFGATALLMLAATIWMFAVDHAREWKPIQETQRRVDQFYLAGRISEQKTAESMTALAEAEQQLMEVRTTPFDAQAVEGFQNEAAEFDFAAWNEQNAQYPALAKEVAAARALATKARREANLLLEQAAAADAAGEPSEETREAAREALEDAKQADAELRAKQDEAIKLRQELIGTLDGVVRGVRFDEDKLTRERKFANAKLTAVLSQQGIAVGEGKEKEASELQKEADATKKVVDELTAQIEEVGGHRRRLEKWLKGPQGILGPQLEAEKQVAQAKAELDRLHAAVEGLWEETGRTVLSMPILDAFDNSDLKIDQIWLPRLTINNNFSDVARFDRCTTCHRAIDKTAPGSAVAPAYPVRGEPFDVLLSTPDAPPTPKVDDQGKEIPLTTRDLYGLELAATGLLSADEVVVKAVTADSPAAHAGLRMGDVLVKINGAPMMGMTQAYGALMRGVEWGQALTLTVRRGMPHPYASHPRLDLFVGSLSPHKKEEMGCTICHDGQGSATSFQWASHTPNTPQQADDWYYRFGWFDNHHWIFPMSPARFVESGCLKCHHNVTELEPSVRFPDPPAPQLVSGYNTIREYGCFGCHEINGYSGPTKRIGPDLRTEPSYYAIAQALLHQEKNLTAEERAWAERLVHNPENDEMRRLLYHALVERKKAPKAEGEAKQAAALMPSTFALAEGLKDVEAPGTLRKVGPSLRYIASKENFDFLYTWIRNPREFRPSTKMPRFFGLWEHLPKGSPGREAAERFEPIEIRGIARYLLDASQPFSYLPRPEQVTAAPSVERGKHLFQTRGCLACHSQNEFPEVQADQGPNLTGIAGKFNTPDGAKWLYSWLREPNRYHVRTKMPNLLLEPIQLADGQVSDPAADIAAYLLSTPPQALVDPPAAELTKDEEQALFDLALEHLAKQVPKKTAIEYLNSGIPEERRGEIKGDEAALFGLTPENRVAKQLAYVGRRAISKYGCSGCHDIPGFEDAKAIGTGLADWGRKDPAKLAFEQINQFMMFGGHGGELTAHLDGQEGEEHPAGHDDASSVEQRTGLSERDRSNPDTKFFLGALEHGNRTGFLWQKLRQPRSYDFKKTENKGYNDRLRMPQFAFTPQQREQVMTFVLGLVSEPPAAQFIFKPTPRQEAIFAGRQVLDKYNCAGCHVLNMETWEFDYHADDFNDPPQAVDFPFLANHVTSAEVAESLRTDRRGMRHAKVYGRPIVSEKTGEPEMRDEDGLPIEEEDELAAEESYFSFELWRPTLINGLERKVGFQNLPIRNTDITKYPRWGGDLASYLFPVAIANEKKQNPAVKGSEAWGWLPPPLVGEGKKVQTDWVHDFLLDPYPIRPAVIMRMPKFNLSSDEAAKIANYFAAVDGAEYPYEFDPRGGAGYLAAREAGHPGHLNDALKIVLDNNYCVKCHLVGDFRPQGSPAALAPNLEQVGGRLRPDYVRNWIANPKRILPYTGMPVNIPYNETPPHFGGVSQELYPGTSLEQLDGLVDFLMNYQKFTSRALSIRNEIEQKSAAPAKPDQAANAP